MTKDDFKQAIVRTIDDYWDIYGKPLEMFKLINKYHNKMRLQKMSFHNTVDEWHSDGLISVSISPDLLDCVMPSEVFNNASQEELREILSKVKRKEQPKIKKVYAEKNKRIFKKPQLSKPEKKEVVEIKTEEKIEQNNLDTLTKKFF